VARQTAHRPARLLLQHPGESVQLCLVELHPRLGHDGQHFVQHTQPGVRQAAKNGNPCSVARAIAASACSWVSRPSRRNR
jgi:hypothetical protein